MHKTASESVGRGHRSGLVIGAKGTGKTTFVSSGSDFAPDALPANPLVLCPDVHIIQFDAESALGALNAGLNPNVIDLSDKRGWQEQKQGLARAINYLRPLAAKGEVKVVGVDLGILDKSIRAWASGARPGALDKGELQIGGDEGASGKDTNWAAVGAQGLAIYDALRTLPCLVVAMAHVKLANNNPHKAKEDADVSLARDLRAYGGDASKATAHLAAGVLDPWMSNASFMFACQVEWKNTGTITAPKWESRYVVHTQDSQLFEAGNRAAAKMAPVEPRTLNAIMKDVYKF